MFRVAALVLTLSLTLFSASAVAGQERPSEASGSLASVQTITPLAEVAARTMRPTEVTAARRPMVLPVLYGSLVALQSYDAYSTTAGLARGAHESNPLMQNIAGNKAAFWAVKAGTTTASIWIAERMWKTNRVGAIVTMVAVNGLMATVAVRNASVLKTLR